MVQPWVMAVEGSCWSLQVAPPAMGVRGNSRIWVLWRGNKEITQVAEEQEGLGFYNLGIFEQSLKPSSMHGVS